MGLLDSIKNALGGNADKVKDGIDKAGDMVDDKTGGQYSDKIDMAAEKAKDVVDQLDGDDDGGDGGDDAVTEPEA